MVITTLTVCNTEWYCVTMGNGNRNVVRLKDSVVECMGHDNRDAGTECYWDAPCANSKPTDDTGYSFTVDELCKKHGSCNAAGKSPCTGWCAESRDFLDGKKTCGKSAWHQSL